MGQGLWIPIKAQVAQFLLARAWALTLEGTPTPPWPWADTRPVARLILPDRSFVVLAQGSGQALAFGPSHVAGSVLPGQPGLSVIAAHRDTHFKALGALGPGQIVAVQRPDGSLHRFRITGARVLDVRTQRLAVTGGPPRLALATCWPLDAPVPGGPLRLVLFADLIPTAMLVERTRYRHNLATNSPLQGHH